MALSYVQYSGDGATTLFTVPFPYVLAEHVSVYLDGAPTSFAWSSETVVSVTPAPAIGEIVRIERVTPTDAPMVDYVDGTVLTEAALDLNTTQMLYIVQEAQDQADTSITQNTAGNWDGQDKVAEDFADPVFADDLATKNYVDTAGDSKVQQAATSAANAATSESSAATSEANANSHKAAAELAETNAETAEANAAASESAAAGSAAAAAVSASSSSASSATAATAKNDAETAKTGAETAETGAVNAKNAAQTAQSNAETAEAGAEAAENAAGVSETNAAASAASAALTVSQAGDLSLFKNKIMNGGFKVHQRDDNSFTLDSSGIASAWIADRWIAVIWSADCAFSRKTPTLDHEGWTNYFRMENNASVGIVSTVKHVIEDCRMLSGKTVTLSFYARFVGSACTVEPIAKQYYGSGTSEDPSSVVTSFGDVNISSNSWVRYSKTITLPSVAGKDIKSDSSTFSIEFQFTAGESGSFDMTNVQLEEGNVATSYEEAPLAITINFCQRYYYRTRCYGQVYDDGTNGASTGNDSLTIGLWFPTEMRVEPTGTIVTQHSASNCVPYINPTSEKSAKFELESDGSASGPKRKADCTVEFDAEI